MKRMGTPQDIARTAQQSVEQAQGQILSHRGARAKVEKNGDFKALTSAATIIQEWMKVAAKTGQDWQEEEASSSNAISTSGISGGDY